MRNLLPERGSHVKWQRRFTFCCCAGGEVCQQRPPFHWAAFRGQCVGSSHGRAVAMHIPRPHRCPGDIPFCQGASCAVFAKAPFSAHGGGRAPETTVAITSCCQRRAAPVNSTARTHSGDHILLPTACCTWRAPTSQSLNVFPWHSDHPCDGPRERPRVHERKESVQCVCMLRLLMERERERERE